MTAADEGVRLEGRIRDAISLLQEVDRKIYQSTISTGPSTALKHADLFREALSALTSMGEERDRLREALEGAERWIADTIEACEENAETTLLPLDYPRTLKTIRAALTPQTEAQSHD